MAEAMTFPERLNGLRRSATLIGASAMTLCLIGGLFNLEQFFQSYLIAVFFWFGIPLGSMAILFLQHLIHSNWGHTTRRILEASTRTISLMILLWVPLVFGMKWLYVWMDPHVLATDHHIAGKTLYLNAPFFVFRAAIFFAIWWGMAKIMNRKSEEQDRTGDPYIYGQFSALSAAGLIVLGFTVSFAAFDWVMTLEPKWYSTIFGVLVAIGWILAAMCFTTYVAYTFRGVSPLKENLNQQLFHDLGNLMMAFLMLWTYMSLCQFLLIWSANIPEETEYFLKRLSGGWKAISIGLPLLHFALPWFILLMRPVKRNAKALSLVAIWLLSMRYVDTFWMVTPVFHPERFHLHWMDLLAPIGVGGLWLSSFFWQLGRMPLLPLHDEGTDEDDEQEVLARG